MEILLLTGTCAVGKSTIARQWAKQKNGAIVECDYFTEWIFQKEFPHWTIDEEKLTAPLAAKTTLEYLKHNMSVAIDNVWTPFGLDLLVKELKAYQPDLKLKVIWLTCELSENQRRDQQRPIAHQMQERVAILKKELDNYSWPAYVIPIDSTGLTIAETLEKIDAL